METKIIKQKISREKVKKMAKEGFGDMVKIVVDIKQGIMAVGGEMHADAESFLLKAGSKQDDLWGANIYPDLAGEQEIEYESFINIRPRLNNKTMEVRDEKVKNKIKKIVNKLID